MNGTMILVCALAAINVCTAVAVVYSKHLSRERYAQISQSQKMIDELDVQWSQLQMIVSIWFYPESKAPS